MINRIFSTLPSFKTLEFRAGLNILLAKREKQSSDLHTRNRAGKTSLIKIIDFLMGSNCDPRSIFRVKQLLQTSFGMDFDLSGKKTIVSRSGNNPSKVIVHEKTDTSKWPIKPGLIKKTGQNAITNLGWRAVLGKLLFNLNLAEDGKSLDKYGPSLRMLFPYFVRRQEEGGFTSPTQHRSGQYAYEDQVAMAYLLGLDWEIASEYQTVRHTESTLQTLRETADQGMLGALVGKVADLRTKVTVLEAKCNRVQESINNFKLLPEYREIENESAEITRRLGKMSDENTMDDFLTQEMEENIKKEVPPKDDRLQDLYKEAGILLPEIVARRFEEVHEFHKSILTNRVAYLSMEIQEAQARVTKREKEMTRLDARRSEIMNLLRSHGALDQYTKFQTELMRCQADLEVTRKQLEAAQLLEEKHDELQDQRSKLKKMVRQDFDERADTLKKAILYFEEVSRALYPEGGSLIFNDGDNGPSIEVKIHGKSSKGITNMRIFCFDMMLMRMCREQGFGIDFLVHDSHLFDGVDERQIAKALEYGQKASEQFNFQYIVTMNEDTVPHRLFSEGFHFESYVLPVSLTDKIGDGGLFGIRFE